MNYKKYKPKEFFINLENSKDELLTSEVKINFNLMRKKYRSPRVSDFIQLLETEYDHKFDLFDTNTWNSPIWLSHLIDLILDYRSGKTVDLATLHDEILREFDFTKEEKKMFIDLSLEERLWAIFILLSNPAHEEFKNIYNKND